MNILMIHTVSGGVSHWRMHTPARALAKKGHTVHWNAHPTSWFAGMQSEGREITKWFNKYGKDLDAIHMGYTSILEQSTLISGSVRSWLADNGRNVPVIVDMDDDPHSVPSYNPAFKSYSRNAADLKNVLIHLHTADALTVTLPHLAKALQRDARHIHILPNFTDPSLWSHLPRNPRRRDDRSVRLMFAGGHGHYGDLAILKEPLTALMRKYDGKEGRAMLRLFFLGCTPDWVTPWMKDTKRPDANRCFYIHPSDIETYWKCLRWIEPDIFVAPVEENEFNRSKTDVKAVDAAVAGAALVCTDWDTYAPVPPTCSLKSHTPYQWQESLEHLILDEGLRRKLAGNLETWVMDTKDIHTHINLWEDVYASCSSRPVVRSLADVVRPAIVTGDECPNLPSPPPGAAPSP